MHHTSDQGQAVGYGHPRPRRPQKTVPDLHQTFLDQFMRTSASRQGDLTKAPFEIPQINPLSGPKTEEQGLHAQVLIAERFGAHDRRCAAESASDRQARSGHSSSASGRRTSGRPGRGRDRGHGPSISCCAGSGSVFTGEIGDLVLKKAVFFEEPEVGKKNRSEISSGRTIFLRHRSASGVSSSTVSW